jgi:hypothetical protein
MNADHTFGVILALIVSTMFVFTKIMRGPIGEALARRLGGKAGESGRDGEIAELRARVAELEERVDFAERVLLQHPERTQVPAGGNSQ